MFESLLEAFFLSLMSYAFAFAAPTRPFERAASIVLHALRLPGQADPLKDLPPATKAASIMSATSRSYRAHTRLSFAHDQTALDISSSSVGRRRAADGR